MTTTLSFVSGIIVAVACILHVICCFVARGKLAKILNFVNIGLHIVLILPMLYGNFEIALAVLLYMVSIFCYTLCEFIRYSIEVVRHREDGDGK